jgi:hypothetical protein
MAAGYGSRSPNQGLMRAAGRRLGRKKSGTQSYQGLPEIGSGISEGMGKGMPDLGGDVGAIKGSSALGIGNEPSLVHLSPQYGGTQSAGYGDQLTHQGGQMGDVLGGFKPSTDPGQIAAAEAADPNVIDELLRRQRGF